MLPLSVRSALRQFTRNPGFSFVAVATLALGIGANTAFFTVLNNALFRPLPYPNQARIAFLNERSQSYDTMSVSYPNFEDWHEQQNAFSNLALFSVAGAMLKTDAGTERISLGLVTSDFFTVFGAAPALGRAPVPADDSQAAHPVAWITHAAWTRFFNGANDIVGRSIIVDGIDTAVVGVLPAGFRFQRSVDIYTNLGPRVKERFMTMRESHNDAWAVGLLKPGVTFASAQARMDAIARRLQQAYPKADAGVEIRVRPLRQQLAGDSRTELLLLCGAVGAVLLIACVNIANMLLARSFVRAREMALRSALGATRGQLILQLLLESILVALAGGAVGLVLGSWGYTLLQRLLPWEMQPFAASSQIDLRVLGFTFLVTLLTGVGFGLAPAWQLSAINPAEALRNTPRTLHTRFGRWHLRDLLVGVQVALALVLLVGASLMIRSLQRLLEVKSGIRPERVLTLQVTPPPISAFASDPGSLARFCDRVVDTVEKLPDVEDAAVATNIPFAWNDSSIMFYLEGKPIPAPGQFPTASNHWVSQDYFRVLGIPLLEGRLFNGLEPQPVLPPGVVITPTNLGTIFKGIDLDVVISQSMARKFWGTQDPIGRRFRLGYPDMNFPWARVIGVVGDTTQHGLERGVEPEFYFSMRQFPAPTTPFLVIKTRLEPAAAAAAVTRALREALPDNPTFDVKPISERMDDFVSGRRYNMQLFVFFAGVALLLALIGLYGVLSFVVGQRSREIGIRIALGATRRQILGDVMRRGLSLVIPGIFLGIASGWAVVRLLQSQLFSVGPNDPPSYVVATILLLIVGAVASYLPALRAVRINPVDAIRTE
ncbi:macrolide export ATP-binding/permease protein MacB [mine drainage metagenome]|uniref:Macrolide export ATP-binding/permease protein MacB n=1 Tax=mine drainage metagenome TaxID=410659 RepID=A0A1J5SHX5_9ZZZZ